MGVRAFDNHDRELIAFGRPLTLIAGPNGVGKTTIIECLRYATTGDLPPNSKGGAFVHDPRMSGEREVLAQVKLSFYSTNGVQMVCTRSMQLTAKKTTQTFKTLEGQLLAVDGDKKQTVSSRCADLDVQVPFSLGVSSAVLNYVIFCHQEDSLWPLAEPAIVKKRFDEIFEATKFTKALDNLKSLKKDYTTDIKVQEKTAQYLQADKERAEKIRLRIGELSGTISNYETECSNLKEQIESSTIRLNKLFEITRGFEQKSNQLSQLKDNQKHMKNSIEVLLQGLEVIDSETEKIEQDLEAYDSHEQSLQEAYDNLQKLKQEKQTKIQDIRRNHSKLMLKQGKIEAEYEEFQRHQNLLENLATEVHSKYGSSSQELEKHLSDIVAESASRYEKAKTDHREKENSIQSEVNQATATKLQIEQQKLSIKAELDKLESAQKEVLHDINKLAANRTESPVEHHESLLSEYKDKAEASRKRLDEIAEKGEAEQEKLNNLSLQADIESLNRSLTKATLHFSERSKLSVLKENAEKKTKALESMQKSLRPKFEEILGKQLSVHTFEKDFTVQKESITTNLESSLKELQSLSEKVGILDSNQKAKTTDLQNLRSQAESIKTQIEQAIEAPISSFDNILEELEEDLHVATQNSEQSSFTAQFYEAAKANASANSCCLLCQRSMTESETSQFEEFLSAKIKQMPLTKEEAQASLQETTQEVTKLRNLKPQQARFKELTEVEIPAVENQLKDLAGKCTDERKKQDALSLKVNEFKEEIAKLDTLQKGVTDIAQTVKDLSLITSEIDTLSDPTVTQEIETPQTIQQKLEDLNEKFRRSQRKLQDLNDAEAFAKEEISKWTNLASKQQLQLKDLQLEEQDIKVKQGKLGEIRVQLEQQREKPQKLEGELSAALKQLEASEEKLRLAKIESAKIEKQLSSAQSDGQTILSEFTRLKAKIDVFESNFGKDPLSDINKSVEETQKLLDTESAGLNTLEDKLTAADRRITDFRGQKRVLQDNLQLRKYRKDVAELDAAIETLAKELSDNDKDDYEHQTLALQDECAKLNSTYASKLGEIKQIEEQVLRSERELETEYATVQEDSRRATVKLESTVVATDDLTKYWRALDAAIMKYHSVKMLEINRVLDELWKKTYKGTDVDTIMIKGESESKGARAYNYRVCMVKQDTELDMRGRCSAGQKVLASVIIRLALSECFGASCGLIVLDEPTTNLDRENSEALARSLSAIIESRQAQHNFQLIVISHDEHFLSCMNASAYCDHFYRIDRDMRQMSRIERLPIGMLQ